MADGNEPENLTLSEKELIRLCLECKKSKCTGTCETFRGVIKAKATRRKGANYYWQGEFRTITQLAKISGISRSTLIWRLNVAGMPLAQAMTQEVKRNNQIVKYHGQTMSLRALSSLTGVPYQTIYQRMVKGYTAEEAVHKESWERDKKKRKNDKAKEVSA